MNNKLLQLFLVSILVMLSGIRTSEASLLQLTHDPLFLNQTVPPALAVTFDDSGSMAWGFMGPFFGYNTRQFTDPRLNAVYYNPNIVYDPPIGANGVEFPQSSFTNAKIDGFDDRTNAPRVNLSTSFIPIASYQYFSDGDFNLRFARTPNTDGVDAVSTANFPDAYPNETLRLDSGRAAFYYNGNTLVTVPTDQQNNFANWYTYYGNRLKMGKTAVSRAFATFGTSFKITWQQLNNNTTFPPLDKFELAHRQAFFDWLFAVPSSGGTPLRNAFYRAGSLFEDTDSYYSSDFNTNLSCQQNFHIALSDGEWNGGFNTNLNPINQDETTGTKLLSGDTNGSLGNYTGTGEQTIYPKSEGGTTLSDIAFHFWSRDLIPNDENDSSTLNDVKQFPSDYTNAAGEDIVFTSGLVWDSGAFVWNPKNDPAYWQHLVTYNIGMGLEASLVVNYEQAQIVNNDGDPTNDIIQLCNTIPSLDAKEAVFRGLRTGTGSCNWPNATNAQNKVDDVWHSSINSRGEFFSANNPKELTDSLNAVVDNILERLSRGSTSSVSSGVVTSSTEAYTPGFDSSNWTGNLFARPLQANGTFGDVLWDMACNLTGGTCPNTGETVAKQNTRRVFTMNTNNGNIQRFRDSTSNNILNRFEANSQEIRDRLNVSGADMINFILGDQDGEIQNGGALRNRPNVLSDIIHSSPKVQLGPSAFFDDTRWPTGTPERVAADAGNTYQKFREDNQDRTNMLYIGSNSGMLHAVNIQGDGTGRKGNEKWAYIPSRAFDNIHKLADPLYDHFSYVDNTSVINDAFIGGSWKSVLISGMRYGGQSFVAIDVTNTSANRPDVLWEFTDEDDADMGYSYGKAAITKIASTQQWVALIPNGYNNSQSDTDEERNSSQNIIGDGSAVLYVVDLETGNLIAKLDTNVGTADTPNGMAPAIPVVSRFKGSTYASIDEYGFDEDGANYAYAGDLYGNIWKFDLTDPNPSAWTNSSNITRVVAAQGVKEQPITIQPRVLGYGATTSETEKDNMVYFATGKYIEIPDRSINLAAEQWVVGILDGPDESDVISIDSPELIEQTMSRVGGIRVFGAKNNIDLNSTDVRGWKVRLTETGERVANPLALFAGGTTGAGGFLLVTTTVTAGDDPCVPGGVSWLLAIDPFSGHKPSFGDIFEEDVLDVDGNPVGTVNEGSGIKIGDLILGSPPIVENLGGGNSSIIVEGTDSTTIINLKKFTWRRRGWKNLLTD